jgi:hypothetical protein
MLKKFRCTSLARKLIAKGLDYFFSKRRERRGGRSMERDVRHGEKASGHL